MNGSNEYEVMQIRSVGLFEVADEGVIVGWTDVGLSSVRRRFRPQKINSSANAACGGS